MKRTLFTRKDYLFHASGFERVGISQVEVDEKAGKSVIWVFKRAFN